jgi:type IV pilus assembly protein PilA
MQRRKQSGFTLIEMLIVVAVVLIIMAIAIPKLLAARTAASEATAAGALKNFMTQQTAYSVTYGGFSATLPQLGPATAATNPNAPGTSAFANLVDWTFANALAGGPNVKSGYQFTLIVNTPNVPPQASDSGNGQLASSFTIDAVPAVPGQSGTKWFCLLDSGVIHVNPLRGAAGGPSGGVATCATWPSQ